MTKPIDETIKFRFDEYNSRRAMRGAPAARVYVDEGDGEDWLWMNRKDIEANIKQFGEHPALVEALKAYGGPTVRDAGKAVA